MAEKMIGAAEIWPSCKNFGEPSSRKRGFLDEEDHSTLDPSVPSKRLATEEIVRSTLSQLNIHDSNHSSNPLSFSPSFSNLQSSSPNAGRKRSAIWEDHATDQILIYENRGFEGTSPTKVRKTINTNLTNDLDALPIVTEVEEEEAESLPMIEDQIKESTKPPGSALVRYDSRVHEPVWRDSFNALDYLNIPLFHAQSCSIAMKAPRIRGYLPSPSESTREPWIEEIDDDEIQLKHNYDTVHASEIIDVNSDEEDVSMMDNASMNSLVTEVLDENFDRMELD